MKKSISLLFIIVVLSSCKKDSKSASNSPAPTPTANPEFSSTVFNADFGDCYSYDCIGNNPVTLLSSNDIAVSSIEYDGTTDKLQVTRLSPSGSVLWQKNITQGYKYKAGKCFETSSGDLIALGATISPLDWVDSKVYIAKLNPATGDTIWTRSYGYNYIDEGIVGHEDANNNYWLVDFSSQWHKATLLKIAPNGDSLTSILNPETHPPNYRDAMVTSNNQIILVGESGTFTTTKQPVYICKYTNGVRDFASNIELTNYDQVRISDVCEASDGNYVVFGHCSNYANTSIQYGFLLKVDVNGNKVWEKIISQQNNLESVSCVEKQTDVFYLGAYISNVGKLYKYDLTTLTDLENTMYAVPPPSQMLIKNMKLYRATKNTKPSYYETATVKVQTIN